MAGSSSNNLLIVGDGPTAYDDLEAWWDMEIPHHTLCVSFVARWFPCDFEYFYTWHGEDYGQVRWPQTWFLRHLKCHKMSFNPGPLIDEVVRLRDTNGSSGLQAVWVGRHHLGYDKIVLAGMPMTNVLGLTKDHNNPNPGTYQDGFFNSWVQHANTLKGFVRSFSGNTMKLLGYPDKEFFNGHDS